MTIEQHVPSRETCERLRDAGFPQDDTFLAWAIWDAAHGGDWELLPAGGEIGFGKGSPNGWSNFLAAPLVSELMEALAGLYPVRLCVHMQRDKAILSIAALESATIFDPPTEVRRENPAEALALLWLRVKEAP